MRKAREAIGAFLLALIFPAIPFIAWVLEPPSVEEEQPELEAEPSPPALTRLE